MESRGQTVGPEACWAGGLGDGRGGGCQRGRISGVQISGEAGSTGGGAQGGGESRARRISEERTEGYSRLGAAADFRLVCRDEFQAPQSAFRPPHVHGGAGRCLPWLR